MEAFIARLKYIVALLRGDNKADTPTESTPEPTPAPTPEPAPAPVPTTVEHHKVAGISYRTEALLSLGVVNHDYDLTKKQLIKRGLTEEVIYRTEFFPSRCELIPEPDNPTDPKAIKVVVDDAHIGYIKKGSCAHIHKLLREDRIVSVSCEIGGGSYKVVVMDESEDSLGCDETYTLATTSTPYYAIVTIKTKP